MAANKNKPGVRRIVLPSGRSIEVVRFDDSTVPTVRQLHICPDCACEMVQPHDWAETPEQQWQMTLECPNCSWLQTGVYNQLEIELLEEHLDSGVEEMINDLRRLTRANMVSEVERFVAALAHDLILPEDF
jgi:hypothetical protein